MKVRIFLIHFFLFLSTVVFAQSPVEKQLQHILGQSDYQNASIGVHVVEAETGKPVFEFNAEKLFTPASVLKVVTSAAALEILGPDYRFATRIGYTGKIENSVLKGDLIVWGGGDPSLGSEYFINHYFNPHFLETWAKYIKAAGIRKVKGNLILNSSIYDREKIPPSWIWEDMGNYYGAGADALTFYDNQVRIRFRSPEKSGEPTKITSVHPVVDGLDFRNEVLSSDINRDLAYVFGSPLDGTRVIRGTIPKNRSSFTIKASNPFPGKLLAEELIKHLAQTGVFVSGTTLEKNEKPSGFNLIYETESPSLAEIVKVLNYESVNLIAEHLVKQVGFEKTGLGTRESGLKQIAQFWENAGLNREQLIMEDGSGLSHLNAVSPEFLTAVLRFMSNSENSSLFSSSLPAAGEGTLYYFNADLLPAHQFRAKSGTLTRVRCFTGIIHTKSGKEIFFSIMLNYFSGSFQTLNHELEELFVSILENF